MRFEVVGNHKVDGTAPGGHVNIDNESRARRLIRGGHLRPAELTCAGTTTSGDPCSKKAGPDGFCHLHSEDA